MLIREETLKKLENSPYRVKPVKRVRSSGKNLHPQLTIRVSEELILRVKTKMDKTRRGLKEAGIVLSYLKNFNALTRYLFDRYLDGEYEQVNSLPKVMLPTNCPVVAIRQPEAITQKLKEKMNKTHHSLVSLTAWLYEEWLKENLVDEDET
jgi:hypothetical protein